MGLVTGGSPTALPRTATSPIAMLRTGISGGRQPLASRLSLVQTHTSGTRHQGFTWLLGTRSSPLGGSQPGQRLTSRIDESMLPQGSREYKLPLRFLGTKQQGSVE